MDSNEHLTPWDEEVYVGIAGGKDAYRAGFLGLQTGLRNGHDSPHLQDFVKFVGSLVEGDGPDLPAVSVKQIHREELALTPDIVVPPHV